MNTAYNYVIENSKAYVKELCAEADQSPSESRRNRFHWGSDGHVGNIYAAEQVDEHVTPFVMGPPMCPEVVEHLRAGAHLNQYETPTWTALDDKLHDLAGVDGGSTRTYDRWLMMVSKLAWHIKVMGRESLQSGFELLNREFSGTLTAYERDELFSIIDKYF